MIIFLSIVNYSLGEHSPHYAHVHTHIAIVTHAYPYPYPYDSWPLLPPPVPFAPTSPLPP